MNTKCYAITVTTSNGSTYYMLTLEVDISVQPTTLNRNYKINATNHLSKDCVTFSKSAAIAKLNEYKTKMADASNSTIKDLVKTLAVKSVNMPLSTMLPGKIHNIGG